MNKRKPSAEEIINTQIKAAQTVLQQPKKINIGEEMFNVAPPTLATLILVSKTIAQLPAKLSNKELSKDNILFETLAIAKNCAYMLGDICAILILGAKNLTEVRTSSRFFGLIKRQKTVDLKKELSDKIMDLSPEEVNHLITSLLSGLQVDFFFGTINSLNEINLLKSKTTQSGH